MKRLVLCALLVGCGSDPVAATPDAGAVDAGADADAAVEVFPAFTPDLPRLLNAGGPTMKDPTKYEGFILETELGGVTAGVVH